MHARTIPMLTLMLAALAPLSLAPGAAAQQGTVDLKPKFETERTIRYDVRNELETSYKMMDMPLQLNAEKDMRVRFKTLESSPEGTRVELVHERIAVTLEGQWPTTGSYDSEKPDRAGTELLKNVVDAVVDKPLVLVLDKTGEITKVEGLDALRPSGQAGAVFQELFDENAVKDMYQRIFLLKRDPSTAEVGESWDVTTAENMKLGKVETTHTLTLDEISGPRAMISITGSSDLERGNPLFEKEKNVVEGNCVWDTEVGRLVELETEGLLNVKSSDPEMKFDLDLRTKTVLKRVNEE